MFFSKGQSRRLKGDSRSRRRRLDQDWSGRRAASKLLDCSLSSIGWRRGVGRGGAFLLVSPLLGPLPTRSSRGEDGELDAATARTNRRRAVVTAESVWPAGRSGW